MSRVDLLPREEPLPARAVVALGAAASALTRRLLRCSDAELARFTVVARPAPDALLLVVGDALPWVDGAQYLGSEADVPSLLLPTTRRFSCHAALVERALRQRQGLQLGQLAVLQGKLVVSLAAAAPPARARLEAFCT